MIVHVGTYYLRRTVMKLCLPIIVAPITITLVTATDTSFMVPMIFHFKLPDRWVVSSFQLAQMFAITNRIWQHFVCPVTVAL